MYQPEGFEVEGKEHKVCWLKRSLYALKHAPRQWYKKFDSFIRAKAIKDISRSLSIYSSIFRW